MESDISLGTLTNPRENLDCASKKASGSVHTGQIPKYQQAQPA